MSLFAGSSRSRFESAAYTVLFLAFFFAVGLAGGVLYRVLPTNKAPESQATSAPAVAPVTEPPAPSAAVLPPAAPAKIPPPAPISREAAAPPALPPAAIPAPAATLVAPLPAAPVAGSPAEIAAPLVKQAAQAERSAKTVPAPPPSETAAAAKAAPARPKAAEPAAKPKPAVVAAAQPPKPAAVKRTPARSAAAEPQSGPFRIQFGAFAIEDNAHRIQWTVEATGMPVEIVRAPSRKGHMLYYVRSQPFADHDAALKAAVAARDKAKSFSQPVALDYVVVSDAMIAAMQGEAPKP